MRWPALDGQEGHRRYPGWWPEITVTMGTAPMALRMAGGGSILQGTLSQGETIPRAVCGVFLVLSAEM